MFPCKILTRFRHKNLEQQTKREGRRLNLQNPGLMLHNKIYPCLPHLRGSYSRTRTGFSNWDPI